MIIATHRKIFFALSGLLSLIAIILLITRPPHLGTDFSGGTLLEITAPNGISIDAVKESLADTPAADASIRTSGERGISIRSRVLTESDKQKILNNIHEKLAEEIAV